VSDVRAFIQARMSSSRFPGKVLAPFKGEPILDHVVRAAGEVVGTEAVVVATSDTRSDDPIAAYLAARGVHCFRGPLEDVFERFRLCSAQFPSEWILRISADSPLLDRAVLRRVVDGADAGADLVSNVVVRTYPRGHSAELIRARTLLALEASELTGDDHEHVTTYFYRHADRFEIRSIESQSGDRSGEDFSIDSIEDLRRLERDD
jgi:spore coat polysaccharide biosynthesis protein SpsF